jgi:putative tryptophan/tyrosine transport system substrate-binding protein
MGVAMRRRELIITLGGVAATVAWPFVVRAQQPTRMPVVGVLWHGTREKELSNPFYHWVVQGFEDVGLKSGLNITLDHQFADESDARYNVLAPQMAARRPDVLVAIALPPTLALKKVHDDIPLIFLGSLDPIALRVVDSLAKRTEAITGIVATGIDLSAKRLQILKQAVPSLSRVALLVNPKTKSTTDNDIREYGEAAKLLSVSTRPFEIGEYDEVVAAFSRITEWHGDGVILSQTPLFALIREELAHAALSSHLPMMAYSDTFVSSGALASYGSSLRELFLGGGALVKRVLNGERAGDIPVLQPTKFELVVNMTTADTLGLTFSPPFLASVDRVIE